MSNEKDFRTQRTDSKPLVGSYATYGELLAPYIDLTGDFRTMARIELPTREQAPAETHKILDAMQRRLGFLPNGLRLLSLSPSALQAFVGLQTTMSHAL